MESLYFLVPCALIFIGLAIKALLWAINTGQYDNLDTAAHRILFDSDSVPKESPKDRETPTGPSPSHDNAGSDSSSGAPQAAPNRYSDKKLPHDD